jgi:mono/diheme cytochrome c family protein
MKVSPLFKPRPGLMVLLVIFAGIRIANAQSSGKEKQYPIPDSINAVFKTSCMQCHGATGGRLPTSKLKFTRWAGYGGSKQVEKAGQICNELRKGKMPPKSAREEHPELIPTKEQIDMICKWAESLKAEKGKK